MRDTFKELVNARLNCLQEIQELRDKHQEIALKAEARRVDEQAQLRASFSEKLSIAEANRIDAIRAVDVNAVAVASQRASDQATVLANQVAQSAEALRTLVASTANTVAVSQQQLATTLSTRITTLEQAQYEGKGRSAFADPAFAELLTEVKMLSKGRSEATGVTQGISTSWAVFIGAAMLAVAVFAAISFKGNDKTVQYIPAPVVAPLPPASKQ